jgi:two-component system chemotaxis sensor kinase CheA
LQLDLARGQIPHVLRNREDSELADPMGQLEGAVDDIRADLLALRVQTAADAWGWMPTMASDLARRCGKKVRVLTRGADIVVDRRLLDQLKHPLMHMVRNAIDHGIERPEERRKTGKVEAGTISVSAGYDAGQLIIELADDGRGLSIDKIRAAVLADNLATPGQLALLGDRGVLQYIFQPGFSTVERATPISGRGVGLDVVRSGIEDLGGTVEVTAREGQDARFLIRIPSGCGTMPALIVEHAGRHLAIAQANVAEVVPDVAGPDVRVEHIAGGLILRLHNRLLPVVDLAESLVIGAPSAGQGRGPASSHPSVAAGRTAIVVEAEGALRFGLIVDRVCHTESVVVIPISAGPRDSRAAAGYAMLRDRTAVLLLDPAGIAAMIGEQAIRVGSQTPAAERRGAKDIGGVQRCEL